MTRAKFDAAYYRRYYKGRTTAVVTKAQARAEVRFVLAFCSHIGVDVRRFSDVGAGTGWWAKEFARRLPQCRAIETFDSSSDAVRLYGHRNVPVEKDRRTSIRSCRVQGRAAWARRASRGRAGTSKPPPGPNPSVAWLRIAGRSWRPGCGWYIPSPRAGWCSSQPTRNDASRRSRPTGIAIVDGSFESCGRRRTSSGAKLPSNRPSRTPSAPHAYATGLFGEGNLCCSDRSFVVKR